MPIVPFNASRPRWWLPQTTNTNTTNNNSNRTWKKSLLRWALFVLVSFGVLAMVVGLTYSAAISFTKHDDALLEKLLPASTAIGGTLSSAPSLVSVSGPVVAPPPHPPTTTTPSPAAMTPIPSTAATTLIKRRNGPLLVSGGGRDGSGSGSGKAWSGEMAPPRLRMPLKNNKNLLERRDSPEEDDDLLPTTTTTTTTAAAAAASPTATATVTVTHTTTPTCHCRTWHVSNNRPLRAPTWRDRHRKPNLSRRKLHKLPKWLSLPDLAEDEFGFSLGTKKNKNKKRDLSSDNADNDNDNDNDNSNEQTPLTRRKLHKKPPKWFSLPDLAEEKFGFGLGKKKNKKRDVDGDGSGSGSGSGSENEEEEALRRLEENLRNMAEPVSLDGTDDERTSSGTASTSMTDLEEGIILGWGFEDEEWWD